jgi:EmrB/QacA subfamily drug resistance transporter
MTDPSTSSAVAESQTGASSRRRVAKQRSPWAALWALVIGFFMILVDTTIVSVANPAIKAALDPDTNNLDNVVWVTSAYLLAYAVPLLITGRLGDRFGPKRVYLVGLVVFTLASLLCGFSGTLEMLILARAVQGLGAALMTPQTMAVITRTFPPDRRGAAMGLWGATAGVATLVGPLAGGLLVDGLGWQWIFFINVPVGIVAFVMAWIFVPNLPTHAHRFDIPGVILSAVGLFLIVFGLQEGEHYDWGVIWGPITVWMLIIAGVIVMGVFIWTQARTKNEPLVPLDLFKDRNFAVSNLAIATVGFTVTSMSLPLMFFIQLARGLTPTQAALLLVPMALLTGVLSPFAGRLLDRIDPRLLLVPGLLMVSGSLVWYSALMNADTPIWMFLLPSALMGIGNAGMWGPLATTATRNLPMSQAGAGAGIYNTTRTIGSVIGSAAIAAFMQSRLEANLPGASEATGGFGGGTLPDFVVDGFSAAMAQAILLPASVLLIGVVAVLFLRRAKASGEAEWHAANARLAAEAAAEEGRRAAG